MPVISFAQLGEWASADPVHGPTGAVLQQQVQQAIQTVQALTNIPQNLAGQVVGLLQSTIQNPLQGISLNLQTLMTGSDSGSMHGRGRHASMTQGWTANGGDFAGSLMNGGATQLAGLMACTEQMMQATQQRLSPDAPSCSTSCRHVPTCRVRLRSPDASSWRLRRSTRSNSRVSSWGWHNSSSGGPWTISFCRNSGPIWKRC